MLFLKRLSSHQSPYTKVLHEVEDLISLAEQQKKLPVAGFTQKIQKHYPYTQD